MSENQNYSLRRPLSKLEAKENVPDFPPTALGQTPEITRKLRKLHRYKMIRLRERVDAFSGQYPHAMNSDQIAATRLSRNRMLRIAETHELLSRSVT